MKTYYLGLLFLAILLPTVRPTSLESTEESGLVGKVKQFLTWSRDKLIALPFEAASRLIDTLCSTASHINVIRPQFVPDLDEIQCYLRTGDRNESFRLAEPEQILNSPSLKSNKDLTIFISGWDSKADDKTDAIYALYDAYRCRGTDNLITIEVGKLIPNIRTWISLNTEVVGKLIGEVIYTITQKVPSSKIHVVGHSLGAHMAGAAGRRFYELSGRLIPRITGLDPALRCYRESEELKSLRRGDAGFVVNIHTNQRVFGTSHSSGDVDFYPNGGATLPPGCRDVVCAHHRAIHYFAETLYPGNEGNFLAVQCDSLSNLDNCKGEKIPMGISTPSHVRGDYYLRTNSEPPFGVNAIARHESHHC